MHTHIHTHTYTHMHAYTHILSAWGPASVLYITECHRLRIKKMSYSPVDILYDQYSICDKKYTQ